MHAKLPFLENVTRLHHRRFAVSRARHPPHDFQVVVHDHVLDCLGEVLTFGRTLGLGTVQREGDQLSPCGDERDGKRQVGSFPQEVRPSVVMLTCFYRIILTMSAAKPFPISFRIPIKSRIDQVLELRIVHLNGADRDTRTIGQGYREDWPTNCLVSGFTCLIFESTAHPPFCAGSNINPPVQVLQHFLRVRLTPR